MECVYSKIEEPAAFGKSVYVCSVCGHKRQSAYPPELLHRRCRTDVLVRLQETVSTIPEDQPEIRDHVEAILAETTKPTLSKKAKHYAIAVIRWRAAGYPVRSRELQAACRLTCQGCPSDQFDPKTETCKVCGCSVKKSWFTIRDKVAMATEVCHRGHWPDSEAHP